MSDKYSCDICQDRGVVPNGDSFKPCTCVIQKQMTEYLKPFIHANLNRQINVEALSKNVYFPSTVSYEKWASIAKSFLFRTFLTKKYEYEWITGADLIEHYVEGEHKFAYTAPLLILNLGADYHNKALPQVMYYLLFNRFTNPDLITWVYLQDESPNKLESLYGSDTVELIKKYCTKIVAK